MKYLLTILLLIMTILIECHRGDKNPSVAISFEKDSIINISNPKRNTLLNYSEIYDSIRYIPLKTPEGILVNSQIRKIFFDQKNYYIFDDKRVFVFDEDGNYRFDIGRAGNGPGEINWPNDFVIDTINRSIEILSLAGQKVSRFTLSEGSFIDEFKMNFVGSNFIKMSNGNYLFYGEYAQKEKKEVCSIIETDNRGEIINSQLPIPTDLLKFRIQLDNVFEETSKGIIFARNLDNSFYIYHCKNPTIVYQVDYGASNLPEDMDFFRQFNYISEIPKKTDYAFNIGGHYSDGAFICFNFLIDQDRIFQAFYNTEDDEVVFGDSVINDLDYGPVFYANGIYNGALIGAITPDRFISSLKKIKKDPKTWNYYKQHYPDVYNIYSAIKEYDNPIIMVGYLKDHFGAMNADN